jgi:ferritin-like metal-binding protein YciE
MAEMNTLMDALVDEVRDLYHAEKQLVKALPKMAKAATSDELREALETHLAETENQVSRLEQVFELLEEKPRAKTCAGMAGIIEEGSDALKEDAEPAVLDAMIIASAQRAEHYEMAAYGTAAAWAEGLGLSEVAELLRDTLDEEKAADEKLTALAEAGINDAASAGAEDDEDAEDEEEEEDEDEEEEESDSKA